MQNVEISQGMLPWHKKLWQRFTVNVLNQRLSHALLFIGLPGIGKRYFAERLAEFMLCQERREHENCGVCKNCQLLAAGNHPDLLRIVPDNKSRTIRVDDIRMLNDWVTQSAYASGYKIVIIDPAEAMNNAASNSLLKTIEEPVGSTIFILVSAFPVQLLPTIRSRCQLVKFTNTELLASKAWLKARIDSALDFDLILHLAHGAPLKAVELADATLLKARRDFLTDMISLLLRSLDPVETAARWYQSDLPWLLENLYVLFIDIIKLTLQATLIDLYHYDFADRLRHMSTNLSLAQLLSVQDKVQEVYQVVHERSNLNTQLLLEDLFIEMYQRVLVH